MIPPRRWFNPAAFALCSGSLFVAGCGPGGSTNPTNTAKYENVAVAASSSSAPAAPPSAVPNSFDEVTARLDRGGSFYLYWSLAQYLDGLSTQIAKLRASIPTENLSPKDLQQMDLAFKLGTELVKNSGIEQLTGLGVSSLDVEPGVTRYTAFAHHYKGKQTGLLNTLFGTSTHPLAALNLLPTDTALASSGDYDLAALTRTVLKTIDDSGIPELKQATADNVQKFQAITGMTLDEFLASLGQEIDLVLTLDPAKTITVPVGGQTTKVPLPRLALLIEVKDDKLFNKVDQTLAVVPSIIKTDEPGLKMRTSTYPVSPDYELRPSVARWDKYLVITTDDHLLRDMIAVQKGGAGFKASPLYAKLSPGLPGEGNGFTLQTKTFAELVINYQKQAMASGKGAGPNMAQYEWFQKLMLSRGIKDQFSVSGHVENGWLTVKKAAN